MKVRLINGFKSIFLLNRMKNMFILFFRAFIRFITSQMKNSKFQNATKCYEKITMLQLNKNQINFFISSGIGKYYIKIINKKKTSIRTTKCNI